MTAPYVGDETTEYRGVCAYAPDPDSACCENPATVHILADASGRGLVGLPTCEVHASIARAAARPVMEHPFRGWCGFPATIWHYEWNECVLDGSGERRAMAAEIAVRDAEILRRLA